MSEPIYRGYDQAGLDAQYNNRAAVPDWAELIAEGQAWSSRVRETLDPRMDVPYGATDGQKLNVFQARKPGAPVLLFIHGGYWKRLDKNDFDYVAEPYVDAGAAVVNVNYDLAPAATVAEIVRQCRAAAIWAWRNAREFNGDPRRLYVAGHSAGGHLAASLALTVWPGAETGAPEDLVKAAVPVSGIYDLEPVRLCYENEGLDLDEDAVEALSPIRHVRPDAAPQLLCVGGQETDEFRRQQDAYEMALVGVGAPAEGVAQPAHNHFDIVFALAQPDEPLCREVMGLLGL